MTMKTTSKHMLDAELREWHTRVIDRVLQVSFPFAVGSCVRSVTYRPLALRLSLVRAVGRALKEYSDEK